MMYWIHENGQTVGPFGVDDLLARVHPDSLVSCGENWVSVQEHPDFEHIENAMAVLRANNPSKEGQLAARRPDVEVKSRGADNTPGLPCEKKYWVVVPPANEPCGPFAFDDVMAFGRSDLLVSSGQVWLKLMEHPEFSVVAGRKYGRSELKSPDSIEMSDDSPTTHRRQIVGREPIPQSTKRLLLAGVAVIGAFFLLGFGALITLGVLSSFAPVDPWASMPLPLTSVSISEDVDPISGTRSEMYMTHKSPRAIGNHFQEAMGNARGWKRASLLESAGEELSFGEQVGVNLLAAAFEDSFQILHYQHLDGRTITIMIMRYGQDEPTMFGLNWQNQTLANASTRY